MNFGVKIGILYGSFVVLIVTMVVMSFNHKVDLVSKDYYAQELKYQDKLDALNNEGSLSKSITHELSNNKIILTIDSALLSNDFKGSVNFFRPSDSSLDFKVEMKFINNQQSISTEKIVHGAYKMQLTWHSNQKNYYKEEVIFIQ